jgi:tetratricopeptide (TPR) repeat protein
MLFKFFKAVLFLLVFSINANGQNNDSIFNIANSLYDQKKYDSAKNNYLILYNTKMISKELFLNLGNSFFKLDSLPSAVLFYEKGLKIAPGNKDLMHNLQFCNTLLKDKNNIKKSIFINDLILSFLDKSPNYWAISSIILLIVVCILFFFYWISTENSLKRLYFYSLIVTLLLFFSTIFLSYISKAKLKDSNYAIIFSPVVKVMTSPSENSSTTYQLHEGSKAKITGESELWYEISFNERKGWIQKKYLKKI